MPNNQIVPANCPSCQTRMTLADAERLCENLEKRTYLCERCGYVDSLIATPRQLQIQERPIKKTTKRTSFMPGDSCVLRFELAAFAKAPKGCRSRPTRRALAKEADTSCLNSWESMTVVTSQATARRHIPFRAFPGNWQLRWQNRSWLPCAERSRRGPDH